MRYFKRIGAPMTFALIDKRERAYLIVASPALRSLAERMQIRVSSSRGGLSCNLRLHRAKTPGSPSYK